MRWASKEGEEGPALELTRDLTSSSQKLAVFEFGSRATACQRASLAWRRSCTSSCVHKCRTEYGHRGGWSCRCARLEFVPGSLTRGTIFSPLSQQPLQPWATHGSFDVCLPLRTWIHEIFKRGHVEALEVVENTENRAPFRRTFCWEDHHWSFVVGRVFPRPAVQRVGEVGHPLLSNERVLLFCTFLSRCEVQSRLVTDEERCCQGAAIQCV